IPENQPQQQDARACRSRCAGWSARDLRIRRDPDVYRGEARTFPACRTACALRGDAMGDRKRVALGKSVSVRVDNGGCLIIVKKQQKQSVTTKTIINK